jgi:hypothetical protein
MIADNAHLVDLADAADVELTDIEILDVLVETFGTAHNAMIERLICMDFITLRREVAA